MLSAKMEDYLKAIYRLEREGDPPVATSTIAETVGVTPPTATSMVEKLEERDLVEREKYKGVTLTPEGETIALEVIRHHRLLETFLTEELGYDWSEVHEEAEILEHHISEEFERRVAAALDEPTVDPHGDPIPNDQLDPIDDVPAAVLADHGEGARLEVVRVRDRDAEELTYLDRVGITPGTDLAVEEVAPIGMVTVRLADGETVSLPDHIADAIQVRSRDDAVAEVSGA
ncbi:metal-dependent transcriptional regulator [Haloarcula nitratireducens]|uniref:Metal-dependent transcriptional regulator n=1 Tax=Haloarcula nitratireducens TaxID=2487749 RepID=A0AAW4P9H9_9EURY|nr:metal-dependent transcriptional regulator [Halomicroarcula nitratireducens]MBX0293952.1 metal-dependent transcriptional regulator [Halomicroarcula nitratireducens]